MKRVILILIALLVISGCSAKDTSSGMTVETIASSISAIENSEEPKDNNVSAEEIRKETKVKNEPKTDTVKFDVNKTIVDNGYVRVSCDAIYKNGIALTVTNEQDYDMELWMDIGLDGIYQSLWCDIRNWEPNETKTITYSGNIENIEHKTMSIHGDVYIDGYGDETYGFDIGDFDLGGESHPDQIETGYKVHDDNNLTVEIIGADAQGLNFAVENKRDIGLNFMFESVTVNYNGDSNSDIGLTSVPVPPKTKTVYNLDIVSYDQNYFSNDLESFDGIIITTTSNLIDRFEVAAEKDSDGNWRSPQQEQDIEDNSTNDESGEQNVEGFVAPSDPENVSFMTSPTYDEITVNFNRLLMDDGFTMMKVSEEGGVHTFRIYEDATKQYTGVGLVINAEDKNDVTAAGILAIDGAEEAIFGTMCNYLVMSISDMDIATAWDFRAKVVRESTAEESGIEFLYTDMPSFIINWENAK